MSAGTSVAAPRKRVVHQVFFWLRNPKSKDDLAELLKGLNTLKQIEVVREIHIGAPASAKQRDVVDASYSVSELMFFDDIAAQEAYQEHPIHKKFVENCSHLWSRVVVYDSVDV